MKSAVLFIFVMLSFTALAQRRGCSAGTGEDRDPLPNGYSIQVAAATDDAHAGPCYATITSSDGKKIYELYGNSLAIDPISGSDVNGDGKPDAVLESAPANAQSLYNYYILTPGESPVLLRQLSVSVPLHFEDKLGDGKVEIWGRDFAFDGVENFDHSSSPFPLIFFRLRGNTLYDVSTLFWPEYEREINDAKAGISRDDIDQLTKQEGDHPKAAPEDDPKAQHLHDVQALVLTVALDYLYAGRGPMAWRTIDDDWPILDHQRIRQVILERRMHGILAEINKQPAATTASK